MKTHEQLKITFAEFGTLLGTRAMLAAGVLEHLPIPESMSAYEAVKAIGGKHCFNMNVTAETNAHCGSVQCIGGTMALLMGLSSFGDANNYVSDTREPGEDKGHSPVLHALFWPPGTEFNNITAADAVKAIDHFLETGEVDWGFLDKDED